jgi:hypothetical protein
VVQSSLFLAAHHHRPHEHCASSIGPLCQPSTSPGSLLRRSTWGDGRPRLGYQFTGI